MKILTCFLSILTILIGCDNNKIRCTDLQKQESDYIAYYVDNNDLNKLIEDLSKYILQTPNCIHAFIVRGDVYLTLNKSEEALNDYKRAYFLDSNNIYVTYRIGNILRDKGNFKDALSYYEKAIVKKGKNNFIINESEDFARLQNKRSYDVNYLELIFSRGESNYFNGSLRNAYLDFEYCIDNSYLLGQSYLFKGMILVKNKRLKEACENFSFAKEHGNDSTSKYFESYCN